MAKGMNIAFFGSSLISAYWNGAATYYRGIIKELAAKGNHITFFEPDAFDRRRHRDIPDPAWAKVVLYSIDDNEGVESAIEQASSADLVIKASGVGVFDSLLEERVAGLRSSDRMTVFWDVDAPATLDRVQGAPEDPFRRLIPLFNFILTYGGGKPVTEAYKKLGAGDCIPIYNALDPSTHYPVQASVKFESDLNLLANRLPDREKRVEAFFVKAAEQMRDRRFILGGSGWDDKSLAKNVRYVGHVYTRDHNAFNCSPLAVLNVSRESMARYGFSPATRVFEAAGAGACMITDRWEGIEDFLEPDREILVADDGEGVAEYLSRLTPQRARMIGEAARRRVNTQHTYVKRAAQLQSLFGLL